MKPAFQPAPSPRPRISPEDAHQLAEATGDLGFTRSSSARQARTEEPAPESAPTAKAPQPPIAPVKGSALKFEVPDEVWTALRQEALNRRVTVKYLVLEALAANSYSVDLSAVPEDGRRTR
jgi:hypothetical protein